MIMHASLNYFGFVYMHPKFAKKKKLHVGSESAGSKWVGFCEYNLPHVLSIINAILDLGFNAI